MDMESKIDQILKIVTMNQQDILELKRDVAELKEDVAELKEDVAKLKEDVKKLDIRLTSLENSVTLIEHQHGESIRALFDAVAANNDKDEEIKKLCLSIKSEIQGILFNHEKRISKLEGDLVPSF